MFTVIPFTVSAEDDTGDIVIGITSDVHGNISGLTQWLTTAQKGAGNFDALAFCGDYGVHDKYGQSYVNDFKSVVALVEPNLADPQEEELFPSVVYTSGNHDYQAGGENTPSLDPLTEDYEKINFLDLGEATSVDEYVIYCFGAAAGYANGSEEFTEDQISELEEYLDNEAPTDRPIFILSHFPLHYHKNGSTTRKIARADQVIDVLNNHPNHKLYFMWGHNHSQSDPHYGQVLTKGESIQYGADTGDSKMINFTYASAGGMRSTSETIYSGCAATISASDQSVSFRYFRSDVETASEVTPAESEYEYTLVSAPEDGEKYLIVNVNSEGSGYALNHDSSATAKSVTVRSGNKITSGVSDSMVWTASASGSGFKLENSGNYVVCSHASNGNNTMAFGDSADDATAWTYGSDNMLMHNETHTTYNNKQYKYLYYSSNGSKYRVGGSTGTGYKVYFYKQTEAEPVEPTPVYTITSSAGEGGSISPMSAVVTADGSATFTVTPDEGYAVDQVTIDKDDPFTPDGNSYTFEDVSDDHHIDVTFRALSSYTVTASVSGEGGTISPSSKTVYEGDDVTFTITPADGYELDQLRDNGEVQEVTGNTYTISEINDHHEIIVTFKALPVIYYTLTNKLEDGDEYLIVSANTANTDAYALEKTSSNGLTAASVHINDSKLIAVVEGDADDMLWKATANGSSFDLSNGGRYLSRQSSNLRTSSSNTYHWDYSSTNNTLKTSTYTLYYSSGFKLQNNGTGKVYLFKKLTASHTITAASGTGGSIDPSGEVLVEEGKSQTFTITPDAHYIVNQVLVDDVAETITNNQYTFDNVSTDHTISVSFTQLPSYTVTATAGEHGTISPSGEQTAYKGDDVTFTITPDENYALESLIDNDVDMTEEVSDGAYTISDIHEPHTISVTFKALPVTVYVPADSLEADEEYLIVNKNEAGEAYALKNASPNSQKVTIAADGTISVADTSKIAWTANESGNLTNGDDYLSRSSGTLAFSSTARVWTYSSSSNYLQTSGSSSTYTLYCNNSNTYALSTSTTSTSNNYKTYLYVKDDPTAVKHTITATAGEHGSIDPSGTIEVKDGKDITFTITPDENYALESLTDNSVDKTEEVSDGAYTISDIHEPHTISVTFKALPVTVYVPADSLEADEEYLIVNKNEAGEAYALKNASPNSQKVTIAADGTISVADTSKIAWTANESGNLTNGDDYLSRSSGTTLTFGSTARVWTYSSSSNYLQTSGSSSTYTLYCNSSNTYALSTSTGSSYKTYLYVKDDPTAVKHTITATAGEHGSIDPSGTIEVKDGKDITFTFTPDEDYLVDEVTVDGSAVAIDGATFTLEGVDADHTVHVTFKEIPSYIVTATAGAGGSIDPNGEVPVKQGKSRTFTFAANDGYVVDKVTIDSDEPFAPDGDSYTFTNVTEAHTIHVSFKALYDVTATAGEHGSVSPASAQVKDGESFTLTITPDENYAVGSIVDNGVEMPAAKTYTIDSVTQAHEISVTFRLVQADAGLSYRFDLVDYANGEGLVDGGKYLLVGPDSNKYNYFAAKNTTSGSGTSATVNSVKVLEGTVAVEAPASIETTDASIIWTAILNQTAAANHVEGYNLFNADAAKYLEASNSGSNGAISIVSELDYPEKYWTYEYKMSTEDDGKTDPAEAPFLETPYDSGNTYVFYFSGSNSVFKVYKGNRFARRLYLYQLATGTVTFMNGEDVLQSDDVVCNMLPVYGGEIPTKAADDDYTYTFAGWSDGENTYAPDELPVVAGDVTYTAVFAETKRIIGHSISLNGDIAMNYYLSFTDEEVAEGVTVDFDWTVNNNVKHYSYNLKDDGTVTANGIKISCPVPIAEMTYDIDVTITFNGGQSVKNETYSVAAYAKQLLSPEYKTEYLKKYTEEEYDKLAYLVKTMLNYGAKAQLHFGRNTDVLANDGIEYTDTEIDPDTAVDPDDIITDATGMTEGLDAYGLTYKGSSVVFLSKTSMRHYFEVSNPDDYNEVKNTVTFNGKPVTLKTRSTDGKTYFELENIEAPNLDECYVLHIGETDYKYSVLDYVKAILSSDKYAEGHSMRNLATATYWYSAAAEAYFPQQGGN
jgi:hypothetical protein